MTLTAAEHARVHQEIRRARNAAGRARRAAPVVVLRAHDPQDGALLWVAVSRSTPGAAYVVRPQADGRLTCGCSAFAYRASCRHTDAVSAALAPHYHAEGDRE